jgi:hypothetical protein
MNILDVTYFTEVIYNLSVKIVKNFLTDTVDIIIALVITLLY